MTIKPTAAEVKRAEKAASDGLTEFDKRRAAELIKSRDAIARVYKDALESKMIELDSVINRLSSAYDPAEAAKLAYRRGELEAVIDSLSSGLADAGKTAEIVASGRLVESRIVARDLAAWQIDNIAGSYVSRFLGEDYAIKAIHSKFDKIAWKSVANPRKAKKAMRQQIAQGLLVGEHPSKIAKRISGLFDGSTAGSGYKRALRIAQTETCRLMSEATQDTYKAAEDLGIKLRNRWDATLDGHTRPSHRKVDGEVVEVGKKFSNGCRRPADGKPAEAINCRCCLTPVLDGWEPDNHIRRDNISKESIPYQRYTEWAKKHAKPVERRSVKTTAEAMGRKIVDKIRQAATERARKFRRDSGHIAYKSIDDLNYIFAMGEQKAGDFQRSVGRYSGIHYGDIRKSQRLGEPNTDAINVEEFIRNSPLWDGGTTYRGVGASRYSGLSLGDEVDMGGVASWSTSYSVAESFASSSCSDEKIIFICNTQNLGTSIKYLSNYYHEDEVLVSTRARYEVIKIEEKYSKRLGDYKEVTVKEIEENE